MKKPEKPIPSDCCGQGCTPCVYERYAYQMEIYEDWLQEKKKEKEPKKLHHISKKNEVSESE